MFAGIIGTDRAAAEPEATAEVLTACAGLPLAIRIARRPAGRAEQLDRAHARLPAVRRAPPAGLS